MFKSTLYEGGEHKNVLIDDFRDNWTCRAIQPSYHRPWQIGDGFGSRRSQLLYSGSRLDCRSRCGAKVYLSLPPRPRLRRGHQWLAPDVPR